MDIKTYFQSIYVDRYAKLSFFLFFSFSTHIIHFTEFVLFLSFIEDCKINHMRIKENIDR